MLARVNDRDARGVMMQGIQQDIECLGNDRRGHGQECRGTPAERPVTERARHVDPVWPIGREFVDWNAIDMHVVRRLDRQQAITERTPSIS